MKNFILINEVLVFIISLSGFSFMEKHIDPADTIRYVDKGNIQEYEIMEEINLDEDAYKVWFGKDSKYPRFVETKGELERNPTLTFYNNDFNEIKRVEISEAYLSPNREYFGIDKLLKSPTRTEHGKVKFILYDENGSDIWGKENDLLYDSPGYSYFVSDKGVTVEFDILNGDLKFYNERGKKVKEIKLFKESYWDVQDRNVWGKFSRDGDYLAINATNIGGSTFTNGSGVILYDKNGEEIWRFDCDEEWGDAIDISNDGKYIISSHNSQAHKKNGTYLFDRKGRLIRKYNKISGSPIKFSNSGIYAIFSGPYIYLLETQKGDILFKLSLQGKGIRVRDLDIAENEKLFGLIFYDRIELIKFNGIKAWSENIKDASELLLFNDESDGFIMRVGNKLLRYRRVK
jgi:hypothetical protein